MKLHGLTHDRIKTIVAYPDYWCDFQKIVLEVAEDVLANFSCIQGCINEIKQKAKESGNGKIDEKDIKEIVRNNCRDIDFEMFNSNIKSVNNIGASKNGVYEDVLLVLIKTESNLEGLSLHSNVTRTKGFFGYRGRSGDLFYKDTTTIELKYMRRSDGKYQIRNALGQTLDNAIISGFKNAILLVWDESFLKENQNEDPFRESWDAKSEKFISMFINNPFGINFAVIRIRVYENPGYCRADIYI